MQPAIKTAKPQTANNLKAFVFIRDYAITIPAPVKHLSRTNYFNKGSEHSLSCRRWLPVFEQKSGWRIYSCIHLARGPLNQSAGRVLSLLAGCFALPNLISKMLNDAEMESSIKSKSEVILLDNFSVWWQLDGAMEKLEQLRVLLRSYGSCLVAYSGGVDSVFLAFLTREVLGDRSLAAISDSASLPRRELVDALAIAEQFQIPVRVVQTEEFNNPDYLANPNNRCYFCKHELFTELEPLARAEGFAVIAYGENASDVGDFRPGAQAASEFRVAAPLKEVGLTKAEIRELSARFGLPTADKPQMACLSSRIPYGEAVTPGKLKMIEAAENFLRDLGFYDVRVRHHELSGQYSVFGVRSPASPLNAENRKLDTSPALARIEVGAQEIPKLLAGQGFDRVAEALKQIGYTHVTLDLQGYRRGSLSEAQAGTS